MQRESSVSTNGNTPIGDCVFCQHNGISTYVLKETAHFFIVTDHAPLVEGHLLIIPKRHYACYGAVPIEYDAELLVLKQEVHRFFDHYYAAPIYWEHGVFHQTVFHAHLHCFPFGAIQYHPAANRHQQIVQTQADIRIWYHNHGHYFYLQDHQQAFLFAPNTDDYHYVVQNVLKAGVTARTQRAEWRSPQQRQTAGKPLIESLRINWQTFQQIGKTEHVKEETSRDYPN